MNVIVSKLENGIAVVALNRPEAANALNMAMARELVSAFQEVESFRVILLTGNGKSFCSGADLKERKGMDESQWHTQHEAFEAARDVILNCQAPVIAAINGAAFGGGLELALACDFIYAANTARFALTETTLGIMPGMGGTQTLARAVGMRKAKELIFSGKPFSAEDALEWGMINRICPSETLMAEATATADLIAANAPLAVKAAKAAMNQGITLPLVDALACELQHYHSLLSTRDRHEGINAFNAKRKPVFVGK